MRFVPPADIHTGTLVRIGRDYAPVVTVTRGTRSDAFTFEQTPGMVQAPTLTIEHTRTVLIQD